MPFTLPRDKIKDMVEIVYNRNCVYQTAYHVIWCPKYRKRILKGEIAEALRLAITAICIEREWPILTLGSSSKTPSLRDGASRFV